MHPETLGMVTAVGKHHAVDLYLHCVTCSPNSLIDLWFAKPENGLNQATDHVCVACVIHGKNAVQHGR